MRSATPPSSVVLPRLQVAVVAHPAEDLALQKAAARLAVDQQWPFLEPGCDLPAQVDALLCVTPRRLELRVIQERERFRGRKRVASAQGKAVAVNLEELDTHSPQGRSLRQPLFKAMGIKARTDLPVRVLDATGGWGQDAWMLASLGCQVLVVERHPVAATLLRDAVLRAGSQHPQALARLHVLQTDAIHLLRRLVQGGGREDAAMVDLPDGLRAFLKPEVVYLDPMFPEAEKRTAAAREPLRLLRRLVGEDRDAPELLPWAVRLAKKRVVVKRPLRARALGEACSPVIAPTGQIMGKSHRFDIYSVKP